mmetsp:Transcript_8153/g.17616  ORF Transcript_8153/g.17616 Transcript_8153/m.17616 type:complete len:466 (+) Transcript_8153:1609-3006(+)
MSLFTQFLFLLHLGFITSHVQRQSSLFTHELGQIYRETHGCVQEVSIRAREHFFVTQCITTLLELNNALIHCLRKRFLFLPYNARDIVLLFTQLREGVPHELDQCSYQLGKESKFGIQILTSISHSTTEHSTQHISPSIIRRYGSISNGKAERTHMIGHHSISHVHEPLILSANLPSIRPGPRDLLNSIKQGDENVRIIIGIHSLQNGSQTFETHARVDVLCGEGTEAAISLSVELDEHVVPYFDYVGKVGVYKGGGIAVAYAIVVDFRTRTTGTGGSHLPKVILSIERQHPLSGQKLQPNLPCLIIAGGVLISTKVRGVQPRLIELKLLRQTLPRHLNGLLLEIIPKGPIPKHLKEGVMVHILPHIVEIVVLASGTDALLGIARALQLAHGEGGVACSQKEGFVLIHACIGEEEGRIIVGDARTGLPEGVTVAFEVFDEGGADFVHGPFRMGLEDHFFLIVRHG